MTTESVSLPKRPSSDLRSRCHARAAGEAGVPPVRDSLFGGGSERRSGTLLAPRLYCSHPLHVTCFGWLLLRKTPA